ncbi:MAG: ABC transporter ATP-binding protein [Lachnospiraceae bacterium]|nr:ABC transporter ATP-binding protein [Lachnospiraceae bacterium]MCI8824961.1 ABC transporter ATP-binding protein [Lachnospiraceae bacterium]
MSLVAKNVCKYIRGIPILENINLEMNNGIIYGFVGRNGSGKTMLFRALSGLMKISEGSVEYNGKILGKDIKVLPDLGLLIENAGLYPELTGFRNLQLLAKLNEKVTDNQIRDIITKVGLNPDDKRPFRKYSLGMKQRIVIAQALMESPRILMLDEPTNALDENGVSTIRELIKDAKKNGTIILLASHNKEDIEMLADEVYIIEKGHISKKDDNNQT